MGRMPSQRQKKVMKMWVVIVISSMRIDLLRYFEIKGGVIVGVNN